MKNNFTSYVPEGHSGELAYCIGEVKLPDIGLCSVYVYGNEDNHIPHMHIFNEDRSFHTCVCIYESDYYNHNGEFKINKFQFDSLKVFDQWMYSDINNEMTYWGYSSLYWNAANPNCKHNIFISYRGGIDYGRIETWEPPEGHSKEAMFHVEYIDLPDIGICEVQVCNCEENDLVPHMHIFNQDNSFHTCICIYEAKYYNHTGLLINVFNEWQKEVFIKWLKDKNTICPDESNWESSRFCWSIANKFSDYKATCPDYSNIDF